MTHPAKTICTSLLGAPMTAHVRISCQAHATTYTHANLCQGPLFEHDGTQAYLFLQQPKAQRLGEYSPGESHFIQRDGYHAQAFVASARKHRKAANQTSESPFMCNVADLRLQQAGSNMWFALSAQ